VGKGDSTIKNGVRGLGYRLEQVKRSKKTDGCAEKKLKKEIGPAVKQGTVGSEG